MQDSAENMQTTAHHTEGFYNEQKSPQPEPVAVLSWSALVSMLGLVTSLRHSHCCRKNDKFTRSQVAGSRGPHWGETLLPHLGAQGRERTFALFTREMRRMKRLKVKACFTTSQCGLCGRGAPMTQTSKRSRWASALLACRQWRFCHMSGNVHKSISEIKVDTLQCSLSHQRPQDCLKTSRSKSASAHCSIHHFLQLVP